MASHNFARNLPFRKVLHLKNINNIPIHYDKKNIHIYEENQKGLLKLSNNEQFISVFVSL
jgi:hypothetical protein